MVTVTTDAYNMFLGMGKLIRIDLLLAVMMLIHIELQVTAKIMNAAKLLWYFPVLPTLLHLRWRLFN